MPSGRIAVVLHAHLPFVRRREGPPYLEERWLFEAVIECYAPLLERLYRLVNDDVPFGLTVVLSPTLTSMLGDEVLRGRFLDHLGALERLAGREEERVGVDRAVQRLSRFYRGRLASVRAFWDRWDGDLVRAFAELEARGHLEIMTTAATHAFLPLLAPVPEAVSAQIAVGVESHRRVFGVAPRGFWLPECGYYPGIDEILAAEGIRFTVLETHGLLSASMQPRHGICAPVYTPSGVAVFGRDPLSSRQVWSAEEGFPGDPVYREFYRDAGFDLPEDRLGDAAIEGLRTFTGLKYHRVTGRGADVKDLYDPSAALARAAEHADEFIRGRRLQVDHALSVMETTPIVVCPYDMELFGHWWYEGPDFLEMVLRGIHATEGLSSTTLAEALRERPRNQVVIPGASSWGDGGYSEVWLDGASSWLIRHVLRASRRMVGLARSNPRPEGTTRRALVQAGRELLLAQASDWPFLMRMQRAAGSAVVEVKSHLSRFGRLADDLEAGSLDEGRLEEIELDDNVFPWLDQEVFA